MKCLFLSIALIGALFAGGAPIIDGKLDDPEWSKVPVQRDFSLLECRNPGGRKPTAPTEFRLFADADAVYLGIRCFEPEMDQLRASVPDGDPNPWRDDVVEIFLSPENSPANYYQFVVGAGGARWQMYFEEKGVTKPDPYAPMWRAAIFQGKDFWSVEIALPYRAFYMTRAKFRQNEWLVNVVRNRRHAELSSWSRQVNGFHESELFRKLGGFAVDWPDCAILNAEARMTAEGRGDIMVTLLADRAGKYELNGWVFELAAGKNTVVLNDQKFDLPGRNKVAFTLKRDSQTVAERTYPVMATYMPLTVTFATPGYADCFYPGQKSDRLQGSVKAALPVTVTVDGHSEPVAADGRFDIDISTVKSNDFEVVFTAGEHKLVRRIRRLAPTGKRMVWLDNGRIVVDGKPLFTLLWYGNVTWRCGRECVEKYPRLGVKHPVNFYGQVNVFPDKKTEAAEATRDIMPSPAVFARLKAEIERNRDREFNFYYLCDEPECRGISPVYLKHLYDFIKKLDPYHPVAIISRAPVQYLDACDIISPHPYLSPVRVTPEKRVLRVPLTTVDAMCRGVEEANRPDKVLMLTPQFFSYGFNTTNADYPTFDETNASAWDMVAHGGRGLWPYCYDGHFANPGLSLAADWLFTSFDRLNDVLLEPGKPLGTGNPNVPGRITPAMLLLVNITPESQAVDFPAEGDYYRFRDDGMVKAENGRIARILAPYEVMVLTRKKLDAGLPSWTEVRRQLAEAEAARRNRGNILFGRGREIELSFPQSKPYNLFNAMSGQEQLFDGVLDAPGWMPRQAADAGYYELAFPKFKPEFSKARLYGVELSKVRFKIFKRGEWLEPEAQRMIGKYHVELDFGQKLSAIKIRLEFPGVTGTALPDLCEIELLQ